MDSRNIALPVAGPMRYAPSRTESYTSSQSVSAAVMRPQVISSPPVFDYSAMQLSPSSQSQTHIPGSVAYTVPNFMNTSTNCAPGPYGILVAGEPKPLGLQNGTKQTNVQSSVAPQGGTQPAALQTLVTRLPQELEAAKQQNVELTKQYNAAVQKLNEMQQNVQYLMRERDEYAREMQHALQGRLVVTQDYAQVLEDRNQLRNEYNAVMSERDTVHREIDSLVEQLKAAQRTVEQLNADRDRVAAEKGRLDGERAQLEAERAQFETVRTQGDAERRKLVAELNRLSALTQERAHESAALLAERDKLTTELDAVRARVALLADQLHVAQAERDVAQRERVEAIEHRETILSETYNRARLDAADRNARELDALRCELDAARRELEALRRGETACRQELACALRELDAAQQQRDFAFKQRDQAVAERESMRLLSDRIRAERDEFGSKFANALRESDELRRANRELLRRVHGAPASDGRDVPPAPNPAAILPVSASHDSAIDTSQTSQFGGEPVYFACSSASASAQSNAAPFDTDYDPPTLKATRTAPQNAPRGPTRSRPTTPVMPKWQLAATVSTSCSSPDANHYSGLATSTSCNSVADSYATSKKSSTSCANVSANQNRQPAKLSILDRARDHVISKLGKYQQYRVRKEAGSTDAGVPSERGHDAAKKERQCADTPSSSRLNTVFARRKEKERDRPSKKTHSDSHLSLASSCSSSLHDASPQLLGQQPEHDALHQLDSVLNSLQPAVRHTPQANGTIFCPPTESASSFTTANYSRTAPSGSASLAGSSNDRPPAPTGDTATPVTSAAANGNGTWPKRCTVPLAFSLSPTHAGEIVFEYGSATQRAEVACTPQQQSQSDVPPSTEMDPEATLHDDKAQSEPPPPKCSASPRRPPLSAAIWFTQTSSTDGTVSRRPKSAYFEYESQSLLSNTNSNGNSTPRRRPLELDSRGGSIRRETIVIETSQNEPNGTQLTLGMRIQCTTDGCVLVAAVAPGSRAERSNVHVGDELVEANRTPLRGMPHAHVTQLLKQCASGDMRLVVHRRFVATPGDELHDEDGSRSTSVSITPTASRQASVRTSHTAPPGTAHRPLGQRTPPDADRNLPAPRVVKLDRRRQSLGVALVGGNAAGIFVSEVLLGSIAALGGVRVGDQILEYNGISMRPKHAEDERSGSVTGEMALRELQKPVERCTMLLQFVGGRRFEELRASNTGDCFFVRACFDREAVGDGELAFRSGNVLLVDSTLWNVTAGVWHAHILDEFGTRLEHGSIPSVARMEEDWHILQAQVPHLASSSSGLYETVSAASSISSQRHGVSDSLRKTFRRRSFNQSTPSRSVSSVLGATGAGSHSPPDGTSPSASQRFNQPGAARPGVLPLAHAHSPSSALSELATYVRVERYDDLRARPVCILGALHRTVIRKLTTENSDRFEFIEYEPTNHTAALLERELEDGLIIDFRRQRRPASGASASAGHGYDVDTDCESACGGVQDVHTDDGPFECISTQKLRERLARSRGTSSRTFLMDVSTAAIDRLTNKHRLHPIVIFIKHKSHKQIREVKDIHYMPEQVSRHHALALFEKAQRVERELHKLFTCTIPGGNLAFMCTQLKFAIDNEQRKPIWIAARTASVCVHPPPSAVQAADTSAHFAHASKTSGGANQQMGMISTSLPVDV